MTISLPGYQIHTTIHQGAKTVIYQAKRESDSLAVVLKTLKAEYPTLEEITRLRHEYQILQKLKIESVIQPYDLIDYQHNLALVLEEFGGVPIKQLIVSQTISLEKFLEIAISLVQTLDELHTNRVIHKDIKPQNILINPQTGEIKLIDFSIATRLEKESQNLTSPNQLEGTLAYMSPEQTGRMNRIIDYRTDFYSLGVTFYEMLTGRLPFITNDPMEIVHCHIAKTPITPHQLKSNIPQAISAIVMKLMAKTAEDRYQSDLGLKADLEQCLRQWQNHGEIKDFTPGKLDRVGQFLIPQKLYGREAEVSQLLETFARVSEGNTEMMLVSGYSGIGKTCVIQEVHKPIVKQRGYFISGKFDQFKRDIPYAAVIQAFQELVRQILTENTEKIAHWKENLLGYLGQNGRIITEVIPEVETIIGPQPEIPQLGFTESQNRFNQVFKQFIHVFSRKEHPLVLFLDDLQWADLASLKLLELLITDPESRYFLYLGAYRDNEVSPTHPTIITIDKIQKAGATINNIVLDPLNINHIRQLVSDTLNEFQKSITLADLLYNKTQGNPFFLVQLFKTLHTENLLSFDFNRENWYWSLEQIQGLGITDLGVVELVARNIQKLPNQTQEALKFAACIGNRFYLEVLAIVHEKSLVATAEDLWPALQSGLLLPLSNDYKIPLVFDEKTPESLTFDSNRINYKFLHDRVQQAAYSLIPDAEKKQVHLKIGQLLLEQINKSALEENIFDIVNQLNIGLELITTSSEKEELTKLNLIAGKKAKAATAYEIACNYLNVGLKLLPEDSWISHYDLTRDIHLELLEAQYILTDFEQTKKLSKTILNNTKTLIEKIRVYELEIPFFMSQSRPEDAIKTALKILKTLKIIIPENPSNFDIILGVIHTKFNWSRMPIENLMNLPEMKDPYKLAGMRVLSNIIPASFAANPMLFPLIILKMVNLSLKYGNSLLSTNAYCMYGFLLCGVLGDIKSGYQFGQLSLNLLDKYNAREKKAQIYQLFNSFIRDWKEHTKRTLTPLLEAIQSGIETGDIEYASYSMCFYSFNILWSGENLDFVSQNHKKHRITLKNYKQMFNETALRLWNQFVLNLLDQVENPILLQGEVFEEEELNFLIETKNNTGIVYFYLAKSILCYLFKEYSQSLEHGTKAETYKQNLTGAPFSAVHNFYYSLALLANCSNITKREKKQYLKKVKANQKQMKIWSSYAPMNFQHKYDLVEAERYRIVDDNNKAALLYDRAIAGAKANGYIQEEALANELAAEFYNTQSRKNIAKAYMTEAYYGYIRWGATAKIKDLDQRYPDLISRSAQESISDGQLTTTTSLSFSTTLGGATTHSTTGIASRVLDLNTVFKASLALSGELVIEKLLEKLLKISIENAGANMGMFLSKQDEQWVIEAMGQVNPAQQQDSTTVDVDVAVSSGQTLPLSLLNYVEQTKENLVLDDASTDGLFSKDAYVQEQHPKSILCAPLIHQNKLTGLLYLENNEISGAFTQERLKVINLLASQISISVDNAKLYTQLEEYSRTLESKVEQRTQQLREKNGQLEDTLKELKLAQRQIVAQEKLASLGSLTAGIAHEIRNPLNFVNSLANLSQDLTQDIVEEIERQTEQLDSETVEFLSESLDYLKRNVSEIHQQGKRADSIITSMLMHARTGSSSHQPGELNFVVAEAVQLAHQSLRAKDAAFNIEFDTQYDDSIGEIVIAAADLGRAIINIVDNACYAARKKSLTHADETFVPTVQVITRNRDTEVEIFVRDNGNGIPTEIKEKIFNPFFTTKPTGEGTGLGLSICHDIIVGQHRGEIQVNTRPGEGTDITIVIPRQLPETEDSETELQEEVKPQVPYFKSENQTPYFKD